MSSTATKSCDTDPKDGAPAQELLAALLSHLRQGILTVTPELRIEPGHSRHLAVVLGERPFDGLEIGELLYPGARAPTTPADGAVRRAALHEALRLAFERPGSWSRALGLLPRELRYGRPGPAGGALEERELRLEWHPIFEGERLVRVLLLCEDATERNRFETEAAQARSRHAEQLALVSELLALPPQSSAIFVRDAARLIGEARAAVAARSSTGLLRALHTLKGTARHLRLATVESRAHALESRLIDATSADDASRELVASELARLEEGLVDAQGLLLKSERPGAGDEDEEGEGERIAVPISKIEKLLRSLPPKERPVSADAVRKAVAWLLQTPARALFDRLERLAVSLGEELGRPVRVAREGDSVPMDHRFVGPLYDAFLHAIRNSLDHGAESASERASAGKPAELSLRLRASIHQGSYLVLEIADDGRGIDVEKVGRRALDKGLLPPEELRRLPAEKLIQLVFAPGFSTKDRSSTLSGRGIGLDVVKEVVERTLSGEATIYSDTGQGTRLVARVPLSALVRSGETHHCLLAGEAGKEALEKTLSLRLRDLGGTAEKPRKGAILADPESAERALAEHGATPERLVVVGSLEPAKLVAGPLARLGVRHFVDRDVPGFGRYLQGCLQRVAGASIWGLEGHLWPGSALRSASVTEYARKDELLDEVIAFGGGLRCFSGLPEILGLVADEMLMNAMFDAPRDSEGRAKYGHLPRTHPLVLEPREAVTLRWGADPDMVGISIEDPFGALEYGRLVEYLARCFAKGRDQIERKAGGAGLGLFTLFSSAHCLIVSSAPGRRTEMICLVARTRSFERYQKARKSFHFYSES